MFNSWAAAYVGTVAQELMDRRRTRKRLARQGQTDDEAEQIAHVLRRCGFGPKPGDVDHWRERGAAALVDALLGDDDVKALDEDDLFAQFGGTEIDDSELFAAMVDPALQGENQLHERMSWYWHTHFTTSRDSSTQSLVWRQFQLIRRMALGNFGDFARAISTDAAMLLYLDGAGSYGDDPNENYAREFLELFTLGRNGGYSEEDVRAAARIFSGWHVDWDTGDVTFEPDTHYDRPVTFMGKRQRWTIDSLVSFVTAQPACHRHVVTRLYHHFVGPDLSPARRDELAKVFANSGLEIKALLGAMLRGEDFLKAARSRTRQPVEWALGALNALGYTSTEHAELEHWHLEILGQMLYYPPNVAGWPLDDRWSAPSQIIARTTVLLEWELPESTVDAVAPTVDAVLARCGIYSPSPSTRTALERIQDEFSEFDYRLELLFVATLTSPEFTLL